MAYLEKAKKLYRGVILFLTAFVGIGAVGGAACMIADPTGGLMQMTPLLPYFQKMPLAKYLFQDFLFPGISLLIVNGISNLTAFALIWKEKKTGYLLGWVFGITLMLWIAIQFWLFAPDVPTLDVIFMTIGFLQLVFGYLAFVNKNQRDFAAAHPPAPDRVNGAKEAVVYFSRMGYVGALAAQCAKEKQCDLIALRTTEPTQGYLGFWWCGRFGMHHWGMKLRPLPMDVASYEKVYLFSPTWVFGLCGPMRQFLSDHGREIRRAEMTIVHFNPGKNAFLSKIPRRVLGARLEKCTSCRSAFGKITVHGVI